MTLKEKIHGQCLALLNEKIHVLEVMMRELGEGVKANDKSSAGDKHETARAMIQIEQENIQRQMTGLEEQKALLQKIDAGLKSASVVKGSLVKTDKGYVFLSLALGKIILDGVAVMVLSPQSPLGMRLMGLKANQCAEMNGISYRIEAIE